MQVNKIMTNFCDSVLFLLVANGGGIRRFPLHCRLIKVQILLSTCKLSECQGGSGVYRMLPIVHFKSPLIILSVHLNHHL